MSGILIDQLERLKMTKGQELLSEDRLEDGKTTSVAPPIITSDDRIKIELGEDGTTKVTVLKP